ncbi:MAG: Clp protease [Clostridiales bacterium]|jgi:ATP-dependent protease ClpP protease subunit|nr:Clp protease [Clostridiales bacterium]
MKKFSFLNFKNNKEEDYPPEIKGDYKVNEEDNLLNEEENKDSKEEEGKLKEKFQEIKEFGTTNESDDESIQVLPIIGQIEGHQVLPAQAKATKYEHVIPQLISIERNEKVKGVLIVLNTVGGDVEAGLAIAEMINSLSKPTVSIVIGGGHSIGVPLATSSSYSFITPSATMIVHPIRMNGFVIGVSQTFEYFQKMQERIDNFIVRTSKIEKSRLKEMMLKSDELLNDMGTILIGEQAVECGLIDEVGGINDALSKLKDLIESQENNQEENNI